MKLKIAATIIIFCIAFFNALDFFLRASEITVYFKYDLTIILFAIGIFICFPYNAMHNKNLNLQTQNKISPIVKILEGVLLTFCLLPLFNYSYKILLWNDQIASLGLKTGYLYIILSILILLAALSSFYSAAKSYL